MAKRGNHEGSIYQRQDGRWVASVTLPGGKRKSYYGKTRQDVAQKLTVGLKARQDGLPLPSDQLKVGRYLEEWLTTAQPSLRPSTWKRYEELLRLYILQALGNLPLARLEPRHLQKLYAACLAQGLAPATVRQIHAIIRKALGQAVRWGTVVRNVGTLVSPPRVAQQEIHPLSAAQARALLMAAKGERFEALYVLALSTGMRRGELLALRWQDVDLHGGCLHVRHGLVRIQGKWTLTEPKTARSRRRIALSASAIEALRHHRAQQATHRLSLGPVWQDRDLVFPNEIGHIMEPGNVLRRSLKPLLKNAGLPAIRLHDLRHTAATLLLQQGVHPKVVSEMLGHSSIKMTLDIYSHVIPDMQHQAAAAMDALLRG
jgi:integrase